MSLNRALTTRWPLWAILASTAVLVAIAMVGADVHRATIGWSAAHFSHHWGWLPLGLTLAGVAFLTAMTGVLFFFLLKVRSEGDPRRERLAFLLPVYACVGALVAPFASPNNDLPGSLALDHLAEHRARGEPMSEESRVLDAIVRHDQQVVEQFNAQFGPAASHTTKGSPRP